MSASVRPRPALAAILAAVFLSCAHAQPAIADQTRPGEGNRAAAALASASPLVNSAHRLLLANTALVKDPQIRRETLDLIRNPKVCVKSRAGLTETDKDALIGELTAAGLIDSADSAAFPGGLKAGVFPPLTDDGSACPALPQPFLAAPGSAYGGHHSMPGGLVVHEAFNDLSDIALAGHYQAVYGTMGRNGLPVVVARAGKQTVKGDLPIDRDLIVAAPMWHDFAKTWVFQWNADGSEFQELNFGGNGKTDNGGRPGNSKTGAHHILGLAEAMARGMPPAFVVTQASAHAAPGGGNEYKVANWIRAAAILSRVDPLKAGYLIRRGDEWRLPPLRGMASVDLQAKHPSHTHLMVEYVLQNLSDADYIFTGPAVSGSEALLAELAPPFGYPSDGARFNTGFRNPVLSYLSAERLWILYTGKGIGAVRSEIAKLRRLKLI
ncbi:hypothetical protein [Paludibacterium paludis]|uniref:Uncharacterized protein n=1 Tax=Paludibacterium paludis TaxID=1225769 RepID=A0A918P5G3_9NEIS|nr:hypothetical protein [Paludibacterium paludis]GGY23067.1 hypothetical protein GCM10011289_28530 [Paludibacterium paludis]